LVIQHWILEIYFAFLVFNSSLPVPPARQVIRPEGTDGFWRIQAGLLSAAACPNDLRLSVGRVFQSTAEDIKGLFARGGGPR